VPAAFAADKAREACGCHGRVSRHANRRRPTGRAKRKKVASDYAYVMQFDADKISHMIKTWNDIKALRALFWA